MMINTFPYELLENIASNLSTQDQYTCLTICKSWYMPFCRTFYRHIKFTHRKQLLQCLSILSQHGRFIRTIEIGVSTQPFKPEDCVTGAIPLLPIQVGVTLYELVQLIQHLPLLQSLLFDHRLWHFMDISSIHLNVKSLPPLDHPRQLRLLDGQMINKLHLRGADMFQLHQQSNFLNIFRGMQTLQDLTIDGDGMWDTEHVMRFTMEDMDTLHTYLPALQKLNITDAVHFVTTGGEGRIQERAVISQLKEFQLFASVDQHAVTAWLDYFGSKYPLLASLNIKLVPSTLVNSNDNNNKQQMTSFTQLLNKLVNLKSLKIHPSMSKHFINDTTLAKKQHLTNLELGLWGHDIETCTKALKMINPTVLTHLVIPVWSCSMDLSVLTQLTHLELFCKTKTRSMSLSSVQEEIDKPIVTAESESQQQEVYTIDTILDHCPVLTHLELNWGQTSTVPFKHKEHKHLKTIRLNHVSVSDSNIFAYLSIRCPKLEGLFLRRCTGVTELNMLNTNFKYIVISELLQQQSTIDYLKLIQFQKLEKQRKRRANNPQMARYYKSYQHAYTFQTCIQRLKHDIVEEPYISVLCGSVQQLVFHGCRI